MNNRYKNLLLFICSIFTLVLSFKTVIYAQVVSPPADNNATANNVTEFSATGTSVNITALSSVTGNTGVNLALNKTVTASSEQSGFLRGYAVDGNTTTRWSNGTVTNNQWLTVDLGAVYNVNEVRINWYSTSFG